jgi:hypothetical protein
VQLRVRSGAADTARNGERTEFGPSNCKLSPHGSTKQIEKHQIQSVGVASVERRKLAYGIFAGKIGRHRFIAEHRHPGFRFAWFDIAQRFPQCRFSRHGFSLTQRKQFSIAPDRFARRRGFFAREDKRFDVAEHCAAEQDVAGGIHKNPFAGDHFARHVFTWNRYKTAHPYAPVPGPKWRIARRGTAKRGRPPRRQSDRRSRHHPGMGRIPPGGAIVRPRN